MHSRRDFLQKCAAGTFSLALQGAPHLQAAPTNDFWAELRGKFPLSTARAYFNTGTMGVSPYSVLRAQQAKMEEVDTTGEYGSTDAARKALARFLGVEVAELSLTHNTTEGINLMAWGLPLRRGQEVIISTHEHAGGALPWLNVARLKGIVLKALDPAPTAEATLHRLEKLITRRTRVIALPHITCTTGQVLPARQIAELGKAKGCFVVFDGAHGAGGLHLNLAQIGCHAYAGCGHKWLLGPKGTGFLYVQKDFLDTLQVQHIGAYSDTGWQLNPPQLNGYVPTAHRYDYGSQSAALAEGLRATVDFWEEVGAQKMVERAHFLARSLQNGLLALPQCVEMLTPQEDASRAGIVAFRHRLMDFRAFNELAAKSRFRVRLVPEHGLNAIRVSTHVYNSPDEVQAFIDLVAAAR